MTTMDGGARLGPLDFFRRARLDGIPLLMSSPEGPRHRTEITRKLAIARSFSPGKVTQTLTA